MDIRWILFSFEGRLSRRPYWVFAGATVVLGLILYALFGTDEAAEAALAVVSLLLLWPSLAIQAKRWHDRDKSGWWILMNFVPVIGPIWVLIENGFLPGTHGANRFGVRSNTNPASGTHET